jgi:DNA adenine methylase
MIGYTCTQHSQYKMTTPKPLIKWAGGKTQLLETVMAMMPAEMANYHEPFIGGGSVLLGLLASGKLVHGTIYASDLNPVLVGMYRNVQQYPRPIIQALKALAADYEAAAAVAGVMTREATTRAEALKHPESYYYWVRRAYNQMSDEQKQMPSGSAIFIFLNKTCFRGLYREGPHGFNVPFGNYKKPAIVDEPNIMAVSSAIQGVVFQCQDYSASLAAVVPNDFVYLDPPYVPEKPTSFTGYLVGGGFSCPAEHATFFEAVRGLACPFLLSNSATPSVIEGFPAPFYKTVRVSARRAIHSKEPDAVTGEVLITRG